jgi:hypothetical protein
MKQIVLLALVLLWSALGYGQGKPPYEMNQLNPYGYEMRSYQKLLEADTKGAGTEYDLKYHRFNWYIDPNVSYISGSVTSYFVPVVAPFSHVKFELSSLLTVDSVIYDSNPVSFSHASDVLDINVGTVLPLGTLDSLCVYYHGNPDPGTGFGSFIKDTHNLVPVIWTLSEPYGAKDWWPCKNVLCDKIDSIDVFVTTPSAYRAASNGVLVSETTVGSDKVYHWKHRYPIAAYLVAIAVTNYSVYVDKVPVNGDTLQMLNYVFPEDLAAFQWGTAQQVEVLQLFDSLFGDYPYMNEKYGHAQFKWGGGMEHQTMSFVINSGFDLLAHEMSHQWYGDKVTCGSWQDIWVNEGFATYCQGLTLDFMFNGYYFPYWLHDRITSITSLPDGSVFCYDTTDVSRVFDWRLSYQKGAMVLHMLRWIMGDTMFFQGMKNIIADPQLAYKYARTADIRQHFEAVSGLNLTDFFNDWIYSEGYPTYTLDALFWADSSVTLTINQTQSHLSVSYFELPVPVRFKNATQDTILVFNNTYSGQSYTAYPGFIPDSIFFDPEMKLLALCDTTHFAVGVTEVSTTELIIRPNPASTQIEFTINGAVGSTIIISDISGKICMRVPVTNDGLIRIDISALRAGTYFVKSDALNTKCRGRFVKN